MPMRFKDKIEGTITNADYASSAGTATKIGTSAGNGTTPVYFSDGKPVALGYTIASSVPANAKFTDTNTTYNDFTAATSSAAGVHGLVPAPAAGQQNSFLRGDKTWQALSKSSVGLGNVDNTADSAKSVKYATSAGSASSATKATNDSKDQAITGYIRGLSVSGTTITYTKGDGTTGTITTQDTNSTYGVFGKATADAAGSTGLVPAPAKGDQAKFLRADGTWQIPSNTWRGIQDNLTSSSTSDSLSANQGRVLKGLVDGKAASNHTHKYASGFSVSGTTVTVSYGDGTTSTFTTQDTNTTYNDVKGATATVAGGAGLVPAPAAGAQAKFLRGDGTWQTPTDHTYNNFGGATGTAAGSAGLVPAPSSGVTTQYLKSNGSWAAPAWGEISGKPSTFTPASHTHSYAGSASAGGSANSAVKLDTATAGSSTQPVYFTNGKPTACTYTLGKSVPSNAVFTDTHTLTLSDRVSGTVVTCSAIPTT